MEITVLGWYGTETIGDRAILAGILHILSKASGDILNIRLGSLYVPLCVRTKIEDEAFWRKITNNRYGRCTIFNSLSTRELKENISKSDIVMIGGGPLMDIESMFMLKYAFSFAKKRRIKTVLMGCGWGDFYIDKYRAVGAELVALSDLSIFRDDTSAREAIKYNNGRNDIKGLIDPAFIAAYWFRKNQNNPPTRSYNCINLREMFITDAKQKGRFCIKDCEGVINQLLDIYPEHSIRLIPMHTFCIGGDDRIILNKVTHRIGSDRLLVQNKPLSLEETMSVYYNAKICVGMRFHSVVLQTVLNGCNYIMDYTEPTRGKTINVLRQLNLVDTYQDRYMHYDNINSFNISLDVKKVEINDEILSKYLEDYVESIKRVML